MLHTLSAGDNDEARAPASQAMLNAAQGMILSADSSSIGHHNRCPWMQASRPLHSVPSQLSMWECTLQVILQGALNVMKSWQRCVLAIDW